MDMDKNLKKLGQPVQVFMIYPEKKKLKLEIYVSQNLAKLGGGDP